MRYHGISTRMQEFTILKRTIHPITEEGNVMIAQITMERYQKYKLRDHAFK
jgi:hypothetical protein